MEFVTERSAHMIQIISFEISVMGLMEINQQGHDFTQVNFTVGLFGHHWLIAAVSNEGQTLGKNHQFHRIILVSLLTWLFLFVALAISL